MRRLNYYFSIYSSKLLILFLVLAIFLLGKYIFESKNTSTPTLGEKSVLGFATITLDNTSHSSDNTYAPYSFTHATGSQSNMIMLVGISAEGGAGITSIRYNGVSLTRLAIRTFNLSRAEVWYLKNPSPGSHQLEVNTSSLDLVTTGAVTFYNIDLNNPFDPYQTKGGSFAGSSTQYTNFSLNTNPNQHIFDTIATVQSGGDYSPSSGLSLLWQQMSWFPFRSGGAHKPADAGSTTTVGWRWDGGAGSYYSEIAVPLNPLFIPDPTATPTPTNTPTPTPSPTPPPIYTISGNVYLDLNSNQIKDLGEGNFSSGTTVTLSGAASRTTTTNASGNYTFSSLFAGTYNVILALPPGHANTTPISKSITFP
jgi:hypothetical protein